MKHTKVTETELWEYISKTADDTTRQKIVQWMDSPDFDDALFAKISALYEHTAIQNPGIEQAKKHFFVAVANDKSKKIVWKQILKYAAVLVVLLSGTYLYNTTLSNNNQIVVQTSFGDQKKIELPDGSTVWLNASSTLSYSSKNPRALSLEGEGFFEVAKDSLHPFTVTTPDQITVKALGTSFNVKSYNGSTTTEAKLLTGKVEVSSKTQFTEPVLMIPNDKITFYKDTKIIIKSKMDPNASNIAWKEGKIQFENQTFRALAIDLTAQFGKQIRFKNEAIANTAFTGSFDRTTPIDEIFEILKISKKFSYKLNTATNEWVIQ